jgi:MOSC domain-containing protein YiiM/N-acetylglutamate synthase-like GNAT family acetyltransferase
VIQVSVSPGGVPKLSVERAWVGALGLEGDAHKDITDHGGPHRAVCLFAIEAIERLQSEGHPVEPGSVGENLTTTGIEWSLLPVGARARIGDKLELELASSTTPCATQKRNFSDGRFSRINIDLHPSDSRMYARVLTEGEVQPGDPITVLPPAPDSRAFDQQLMYRLDRAEAKSAVAAWQAAAEAGYDVRIVEDGDIAMAAAPDIPGPGFNHAVGFAQLPNLISMATDFYDANRCPGWVITDTPPWPDAERGLVIAVLAGLPDEVAEALPPDGVLLRPATADEGPAVERVYAAAESTGIAHASVNPWPDVYSRLAENHARTILVAEEGGEIVGVSSLHISRHVGWLRGAAVVPEARGRGIQRALISARTRIAAERGCDLVGAWAEDGGRSSANLQRMGLRQIGIREHYQYLPVGIDGPTPA